MSVATIAPLPTLVLAAVAALAMSGCTVSLDLGDDTTRRIEDQSIELGQLVELDVSTDNGQIEIVGGDVGTIELRAVLVEEDEGDAAYLVERTTRSGRDVLVVDGECDAGWFDQCSVGFRVTVPSEFDVSIHTDNGRVGVDGIAGDLDIETDNGAIDGDDLRAAYTTAQTDNGRIELSFESAPAEVDVQSDNGAIVVRVPEGYEYDVDAASDNGAIDIAVAADPASDRSIRAASNNGSIHLEYDEQTGAAPSDA